MARFVIGGHTECEVFSHLCYIADRLSNMLPDFCYEALSKSVLEWKPWLFMINTKYHWHHLTSPIVWKEISFRGGKAYYIGGATEFWEYVYEYYGLESYLSEKNMELLLENGKQFIRREKKPVGSAEEARVPLCTICITGASNPIIKDLLSEILTISKIHTQEPMKIYLHDDDLDMLDDLYELENDCKFVENENGYKIVSVVEKLAECLPRTDILIILSYIKRENIHYRSWIRDNCGFLMELSNHINHCARKNLRIVFGNFGPCCYNATILCEVLTQIEPKNIVAASSDEGLEVLYPISKRYNVAMKNIACPPVWGFTGVNKFVDIKKTVIRYNMFVPNDRVIKVKTESTLCVGTVKPQLRMLEYLIHWDKLIWKDVADRKELALLEPVEINKVQPICDIVKFWQSGSSNDEIISMGILSDGSKGIRRHLFFSRPCVLEKGKWIPLSYYPLTKDAVLSFKYLQSIIDMTLNYVRFGRLHIKDNSSLEEQSTDKIDEEEQASEELFVLEDLDREVPGEAEKEMEEEGHAEVTRAAKKERKTRFISQQEIIPN